MATDLISAAAPAVLGEKQRDAHLTRPRHLWPPVVMLALFWAFYFANDQLDMSMFARFMSRLGAHALLLAGFFAWWLSRRQLSWGERLQAVLVCAVGTIIVLTVADPSVNGWTMFLGALAPMVTAWTAALFFTRNSSSAIRRAAVGLSILLVLGAFTLLRWDGIDGAQHGEYSWRWQPTSEALFLAAHKATAPEAPAELAAWTLQPEDVPGFRGANRDAILDGTRLELDWNSHAPQQAWRQRLGPAWSSLIVVDGHVVTQEQRDEEEVVACYDATSGKEIWVHADPVRFFEGLSGAGPRGTPTFADGRIYALGGKGHLDCLDAATGKLVWSHDLVEEAAAVVPMWGFAVSPLVTGGKVIVFAPGSAEKPSAGLVAFDATSGDELWRAAGGGDTYSSPQLVELAGVPQVLMHDNNGLRAYSPDDGKLLWEVKGTGSMSMPMLQPQAVGPGELLVLLEPGLTLLDVDHADGQWSTKERWISNRIKPGFNDVVTHRGKIYGLDDGILCALDLDTGERLWKKGRYGHGQLILLADQDALLVQGARGEVLAVDVSGEEPAELGKFDAIEGKTWNHPALVGNRLYVRNGEEIACYELPSKN
jgi:outer membrane protein assembly factor BamB